MPEFPLSLPIMAMLCALMFLAGFIDSIAGGGGLIGVPAYLATGLPAHTAFACNKVTSAVGTTFSTLRFLKNRAADLRVGLLAAAASYLGSAIATQVVLVIPEENFKIFLLVLIPVAAVVIFTRRDVPDEDHSDKLTGRKKWLMAGAVGFFIGAYDGMIGPGSGTFAIIAFSALMGYDLRKSAGNAKLVNLASNYASVVTLLLAGKVLWGVSLVVGVFNTAGHLLGSGLALKNGAKFIRPMLFVVLGLLLLTLVRETFFA